jgi:hypothetical protein
MEIGRTFKRCSVETHSGKRKKLRALWAEFARTGKISDHSERPEILELRKV